MVTPVVIAFLMISNLRQPDSTGRLPDSGLASPSPALSSPCAYPALPWLYHAFLQVLAEVLQQQARLDAPHALRHKQFERRVKGEAPPPTEAELQRAR